MSRPLLTGVLLLLTASAGAQDCTGECEEQCGIAMCFAPLKGGFNQAALAPFYCPPKIREAMKKLANGENPHECPYLSNEYRYVTFALVRLGSTTTFCDSGSGDTRHCIMLEKGWYAPEPVGGIRIHR